VASDAYPGLSPLIRKKILASADAHHLPLVAMTDWHGITGILRTWTAVRVPDSANLSRQQRAAAVLEALRRHECSNITPIVVGRMNQVSFFRTVFAPFIETIRYGLGLSLLRLLSWWVWAIVFFGVATVLLYFGIHPGRLILAVALVSMGAAIIIEGLKLLISHFSSQAPYFFPAQIGWLALALGSAAVVFGIIDACRTVIRR